MGTKEHFVSPLNEVVFSLNGKIHKVTETYPWDTNLTTYIRQHANLPGTKRACGEGGCGSCMVVVKDTNAFTKKKKKTYTVNSCVMSIFSCHGKEIITIEGIGDRRKGYHKVQKQLAKFHGTQCGFCSPGMVMNMFCLMNQGNAVTAQEVENSLDGNLCRCTGYRSILDAFKSLAVDASEELRKQAQDVEDLHTHAKCNNKCTKCKKPDCFKEGFCEDLAGMEEFVCVDLNGAEVIQSYSISPLHMHLQGNKQWFKVLSIPNIFNIFETSGGTACRLVAGNTGYGLYSPDDSCEILIDVQDVSELKEYSIDSTLKIGGNMTLSEVITLFNNVAKHHPNYSYVEVLANHMQLVASVPIRNVATIAGNLSIKHQNNRFPSDIFMLLETVGATVVIATSKFTTKEISLAEYLDWDMKHKVLVFVTLPPLHNKQKLKTYKIMPRAQNATAYINAGFLFNIDETNEGEILDRPNIVYGGISSVFIHATETENFLTGKNLFEPKIFRTVIRILESEIKPDSVLPDASPRFRKILAVSLFYKFVLSLHPKGISKKLISGGTNLQRPLSSGKQSFGTDYSYWPVNQPVQKMDGLIQCSGEAVYLDDLPVVPDEVYAAFVLTNIGQGYIENIDPSPALEIPDVITFIGAKSIPGKNNYVPLGMPCIIQPEEVFCSSKVLYFGQPLGVIVAKTIKAAQLGSQCVKVKYMGVQQPSINMREVILSGDKSRLHVKIIPSKTDEEDIPEREGIYVIKGSFDISSQFHFSMETQSALCVPNEGALDVHTATQWMDLTQTAISEALDIPGDRINITVRRLGGSHGCKITRASHVATACAIASHIVSKPVRFITPLETNMQAIGKRAEFACDYKVKVDGIGKILDLKADLYSSVGCSWNEAMIKSCVQHFDNSYDKQNWSVRGTSVRLDIPSTTFCGTSGSSEGIAAIEYIMEHISKVIKKDPIEVRITNMIKADNTLQQMIQDLKRTAEYDLRKESCELYNQKNRWKKRGIALVPIRYPLKYFGRYTVLVSIFADDGTVAVVCGGIEDGQGIATKVAQVVAYTLKVPLEYVAVKPAWNVTSPNDSNSAFSYAEELCAYAAMVCCRELLRRLEPVRQRLRNPTWVQLTRAAREGQIDMCASHMYSHKDNVENYNVYGVTLSEVLVDVLTGQYQIVRVDILEDVGYSLSPQIDVGQIEGSFVMGLGHWLMEELIYHPHNGKLLTNTTWNYKIPGGKDIPIDFRIYFRKNAPNQYGVLRSKASGELSECMSCSVFFALKNAVDSARKDAGDKRDWIPMDPPATVENVFLSTFTKSSLFTLK